MQQPLKLSKKSVNDETVFDFLSKDNREDLVVLLNKLTGLKEFSKLKLAQRKKVLEKLKQL